MRKRDAKRVASKVEKGPILTAEYIKKPIVEPEEEIDENEKLQIDEAEQEVAKQKSKKKKILNLVFFLVNIGVVVGILIYQLSTQEVMPFATLFTSGLRFEFLLMTVLVFATLMFFEALRTNTLIKKASGRSRPFLAYKSTALCRYYDVITPMSTGGQPFQILYLRKRGLSTSGSLGVPLGRYIMGQITTVFISAIAMILIATTNAGGGTTVISVAFYVGFSLNFLVAITVLFLSVSKSLGKKLVVGILKLLRKIKIIKNYEKQYNKVMKLVNDYQTTMQDFTKSKATFFKLIVTSIMCYLLTYTIPFFVTCCFLGFRPELYLNVALMGIMIDVAAGFMPLPGGTGVSELSFTALFASIFAEGVLFWALILWRIFSYYIYMIQGIGIIMYDYFVGDKKYRWLKRKWELEAESADFKEAKLKNYKRNKKKFV